ncbi:MAG TPA: cytochrome c oxidase subunit 3 [Methylomirabilota bacterium]|nr:cytochrome c oxidase subunit 3 [Methylomirabilota bacterium]
MRESRRRPPALLVPADGWGRPRFPTKGDGLGDGPASESSIPAPVLGTLFLIAGDVMLFAGLLFVFWVLRLAAPVWPPPLQPRLPVALTAVNTLVLLASSGAVVAALRARRRRDQAGLRRGLALGALLGGLFLAIQGYEWVRLIGFGLTANSGIYGAIFYVLIGTHAVHVLAALAWLAATVGRGRGAGLGPDAAARLEACALYWYFVVALWPVLYVSVYLL